MSGNTILCSACSQQLSIIQRKCSDAVRIRLKGVNSKKTNNSYLYNSSSLIKHKVDRLAQNAKSESVKRSKAKAKKILKMVTEKDGVNLSGANLEEVFPAIYKS